jgi:threonine/homoserine efflux transporter RhtA
VNKVKNAQNIINIVLKAVAVGMSISSIVLGAVGVVDVNTQITLLGIGLAALAVASLSEKEDSS